jgi:hypothetical protein
MFLIFFLQRIETNDINKKIICGLKPNTNYNFEIVTVPEGGKGYESDPVFNSTSTDIDCKILLFTFQFLLLTFRNFKGLLDFQL